MSNSVKDTEKRSNEIAQIADEFLQACNGGAAPSVEAYMQLHSHLGNELREALEAIELLTESRANPSPKILGDFTIHHELGRGGMGVVYLATQTSLQRKVALKVFTLSRNDKEGLVRFEKETRTIAALRHEQIVPVYTVGRETVGQEVLSKTGDQSVHCYFAMPWIEGETVAQLIALRKAVITKLSEPLGRSARVTQIAEWGAQIAEALQYAHEQGVIHRDVKPSNLIVDHTQKIWLTDFGLAQQSDSPTGSFIAYQGTPNYMSPEQASAIAGPVDHRTDIYSLGVTLIEWITGRSLVGGSNPVESLSKLQHNGVEDPHDLLRGYNRDLIAVLQKCVAREPKDRYQTAAELAADLRAFANGRPVAARGRPIATRYMQAVIQPRRLLGSAMIAATMLALVWASEVAWRAYAKSKLHPVIFESSSGEWLTVNASDASKRSLATFMAPSDEVLLPAEEVRLDVSASQRLS